MILLHYAKSDIYPKNKYIIDFMNINKKGLEKYFLI